MRLLLNFAHRQAQRIQATVPRDRKKDIEKMNEESLLNDSELGRISIHHNARAKQMTFRCKDGQLACTVPVHATGRDVALAVDKLRDRLRRLLQRGRSRSIQSVFTPQSRIEADGFVFECRQTDGGKPRVQEDARGMTFLYPAELDWTMPELQQWLTRVVEECLRRRAQRMLVPRLMQLATQRGLHPRHVNIRKTKSRWGSCSTQGNIQLSLYLMTLPPHLRDFIMHHELTHLMEMNHGERFHALLNQALGGQEAAMQREMKLYHPSLTLQ